ncbi:MAG: hypothetical protein KGM98_10440 [Bacteroidota bacterium]|nr:hypothetical protein [Bacteroidota bacterium]
MKKFSFICLLFTYSLASFSQKNSATNFGIEVGTDGMFGLAGVTQLKQTDNPLVNSDLARRWAVSAGIDAEWLTLHTRKHPSTWGRTMPGFGIKTKLNWQFFRADNSQNSGNSNLGLNYVNLPILFEYCVGYHQGVTRASRTPGTTTYRGTQNYDGSVTVTETSTPGTYNPGGVPTSTATFLYFGPQICYLFKSFNYTGDPIKNPELRNTYVGLTGGVTFWLHGLNLDFFYQKGLTSICSGKNVTVDGYMLSIGINFGKRLYNRH